MSPNLSIIPNLHLTFLSILEILRPQRSLPVSVLSAAENTCTHKVHRGQPIPAPAQAMPAPTHTIFAPILLPCQIYLALEHCDYETEHVVSNLPYCSYFIRDTLEIEPGHSGVPTQGRPRHLFCRNRSSLSSGITVPSHSTARTLGTTSPGSDTIIVKLGESSILGIS
jgi:hypothetical protein